MFRKKQLLSVLCLTACATINCYTSEHTQYAAQQFINATNLKPTPSEPFEMDLLWPMDFQWTKNFILGKKNLELTEPNEFEQLTTLFEKNKHYARIEQRINKEFLKNMNLVCGEVNRKNHLLSYVLNINELSIPACERAVALITQPINEKIATSRGAIIKAMVDDPQLITELRSYFTPVQKGIASLFYFDQKPNEAILELQNALCWRAFDFTGLNDSVKGLELATRLITLLFGSAPALVPAIYIGALAELLKNENPNLTSADLPIAQVLRQIPHLFRHHPGGAFFLTSSCCVGTIVLSGLTLAQTKMHRDLINLMQTQLINVANYIKGMKKLYAFANKKTIIKQNWQELEHLESLIAPSPMNTYKFNRLLEFLNTDTFIGEASFFSIAGRVLVAYQLLSDELVRKKLNEAINAFAEFEVYTAVANTIDKARNRQATFCFANFANNDKPYINAVDFWSPFINPDEAVTNTIELGGDTSTRNIILTGPHASGKSTFSKALIYNALLAQTFGIAAARQFTLTPFTILNCYLNITDDTTTGLSGLKTQPERTKDLFESVKRLNDNEFAIIIIDDIFTGTTPEHTEGVAYKFMKDMIECENCIFINPTHYSSLVKLGNEKIYASKNFHMEAIAGDHGKVPLHTYKLAEGPSYIHNTQQVTQNYSLT